MIDRFLYWILWRLMNRYLIREPGQAYLIELHMRRWREDHPLPESLMMAAEKFHESMRELKERGPSCD